METTNVYSLPMEKKFIQKTLISESPAHRRYHSDEHNADYDLTNAVDFLCDLDVPVRAALDGKVVYVQNGVVKNWDKFEVPPKDFMSEAEQDGNYVLLAHENNEFSIYSHLRSGEIKVKPGDSVKTGKLLGYIGHTGWSIKPHLHFMVFKFTKPKPARDFVSLKVRWSKSQIL